MDNQILINQAQHLFVMLRAKQDESIVANDMVFNRLSPVVRRAFRRYRRRLQYLSKSFILIEECKEYKKGKEYTTWVCWINPEINQEISK